MGKNDTLGDLLRILRTERNLKQETLAALAGLSLPTIQRAEAGGTWRATTAVRVLQALAAESPLRPEQAESFRRLSGLPKSALRSVPIAPEQSRHNDTDLSRVLEVVSHLQQRFGTQLVYGALLGIDGAFRVSPPAAATARSVTVVDPPVQRKGYVEEVHHHFDVVEERIDDLDDESAKELLDRLERITERLHARRSG